MQKMIIILAPTLLERAKEQLEKDLERAVEKIKDRWRKWVLKEKSSKKVESKQTLEQ